MTEETHAQQRPVGASQGPESPDTHNHLPPEDQVAALLRDLEEARQGASRNLDLAQRAQAELANYRRRSDEERLALQKYANSRLITRLLAVADELDLAMRHAGESGSNSSWLEGVTLIQRKLSNLLDSEGVAKIDAPGVMFNPLEHEALEMEETTKYPPGFITKVMRCGYRLHDRVIQPAQVAVARQPHPPQADAEPNNPSQGEETEYD
jgi:molecular chaperone GrpE